MITRREVHYFVVAIVIAIWAATLIPLFEFAVADKRLLDAFAVDELAQLNLLHNAASARSFAVIFGPYGHLVFNLILTVARLMPGVVTDGRILHVGRAINLAFGAAAALVTFGWAWRAYGAVAAWIAFSLVIVNATFYVTIATICPDIGQLFFLTLSLAFATRLVEEPERRWLVLASVAAGLAFACKYSGLFVLPIIAAAVARRPVPVDRPRVNLAVLRGSIALAGVALIVVSFWLNTDWITAHLTEDGRIDVYLPDSALALGRSLTMAGGIAAMLAAVAPWLWTRLERSTRGVAVLWSWYVALATFLVAFVAGSPYSLRKVAFLKGWMGESAFARPVSVESVVAALHEFGVAVGYPAAIFGVLTMAVVAWQAFRSNRMRAIDAVLTSWIVLYVIVLLLPLHEVYARYALPLLPALAMLAGRGTSAFLQYFERSSLSMRRVVAVVVVLAAVGAEASLGSDLLEARTRQGERTTNSARAQVGAWLQCRFPASTRIVYDYFVYVPSTFPDAFVTWGGTREWLRSIDPDVVIVQESTAGYAGEEPDHREYYECLAAGTCGYERALTRGLLAVYVRQGRAQAVITARGCS